MNRIIQTVSCFLCCLLTILMICGCQTDAASDAKEKSNSDLLGDTDGDGSVSIGDVTVIQQHIANIISLQNNRLKCADINGNGSVDITDATELQRYLAEYDVTYAVEKPISNDTEEPPAIEQTGMTNQVPSSYLSAAAQGGTVREIKYQSKDYAGNSGDITKQAFVYLPYGYDEADADTRYNILYLMHGWGGHAGEYFEYANIKNIFDNMIANGDIEPLIVVSATFYHDNSDRDFGSSEDALRAFHNDFEKHLMPAVEGQFHTYAKSTSAEDLKASRDHRAFGGFSLGPVTTWLQFCYDYDYIRYFLPMSGSSWYYGTYGNFRIKDNVDFIESLVKDNDLDSRGYFIYHAVGTQDQVKSQSIDMANEMLSREIFTPNHYVFYQKEGGVHDHNAVCEFIYNALPYFFRGQTKAPADQEYFNKDTAISEVQSDPAFGNYGQLIFPVNSGYYSGSTLGDLSLTWYNYIDPDKTVEIANYMKNRAVQGDTIFYDIYTDAEKSADPAKNNTGLFFFKGEKNKPFAICNAGGGFAYVGAMHDSFPHALELSKMGYNAFALIYRPGSQTACEDLARAIAFIHEHADELEVSTENYSLWGGSAGARMASWLGTYGTRLAKENKVDFILAVGGGSVIDCCKIVSAQAKLDQDIWDFEYQQHGSPTEFIPMGAVVTAFGTGAEMNNGAVITNEDLKQKSPLWGAFYDFAVLDVGYTMTMPMKQVISGSFDTLSHCMETYFGSPRETNLSDEINEAVMRNVIKNMRATLKNPDEKFVRSELIWAAAMGENGILKLGKVTDFQCHMLEHQLGAYTDCNHGFGLAVIHPVLYRHIYKSAVSQFAKFAVNVWDVKPDGKTEDDIALVGINALADFIKEMDLPTTFSEMGITDTDWKSIADSTIITGGCCKKLNKEELLDILIECK